MEIDLQKAREDEVSAVFALYEKRIAWMEEKGIAQWNKTGYLSVYPLSYFQTRQREGSLFVCRGAGGVRAAAVLLEQDDRWPTDGTAAFCLHHLATDPAERGLGRAFLGALEEYARRCGKEAMRLDCAQNSAFLNAYYESLGYRPAGTFQAGSYHGLRREKRLD